MKKLLFTAAVALYLAACSQQSDFDVKLPETASKTMSVNRSADEAILIANQVLSAGDIASRGGSYQKRATKVHAVLDDQSRSGSADTLLYAVDVENDGGFILVAAPRTIDPIMAIIDEGSYNAPENLKNEPYQETLELIKANIAKITIPIRPEDPDTSKLPLRPSFYYDTIDIKRIQEPTVKVAWGQDWPENLYCSNGKTGCAPLAIAQFMATKAQPSNMTYTFSGKPIAAENINWPEIKKHIRSSHPDAVLGQICMNCTANQNAHQTLARIIREIGEKIGATYKYDNTGLFPIPVTGADPRKIASTIKTMTGIDANENGNGLSNLYTCLLFNKGIGIISAGYTNYSTDGHTWIADAIRDIEYRIRIMEYSDEFKRYIETGVIESYRSKLIHYNWGESGVCNGWFALSGIDQGAAEEYDYPDEQNNSEQTYSSTNLMYSFYKL